ncbi:MAG TPA: hypothetical protein VFM93_10250 [Candidatus Limnocylindria bacterium]|nr:hypothetical protein [Candidatus Limnocylindria bacterium]
MNAPRTLEQLLDVVRALVLLQGAILVAATIEALIWGSAFGGGAATAVPSAAAAAALLVARANVGNERRWARRVLFVVEGALIATIAIDGALALLITRALPPATALVTRLLIPLAVIALLRRARAAAAAAPLAAAAA